MAQMRPDRLEADRPQGYDLGMNLESGGDADQIRLAHVMAEDVVGVLGAGADVDREIGGPSGRECRP